MAVAVDPATLMGIQRGAVGVLDPPIRGEGRRLTAQGLLDGLLRGDRPGVVQIQLRQLARHQRGISQACRLIFRGMFGDGQRRRDGFANRRFTAGRGTGRALALTHIQRDTKTLVTVEFDRFHLTLTHRGGQALLHRYRHLAGTGALLSCLGNDLLDLRLQLRHGLGPDDVYCTHKHS